MFSSYEESVMAYADHHGNLSRGDARVLLAEHGWTIPDLAVNQRGCAWAELAQFNAAALLRWLGY